MLWKRFVVNELAGPRRYADWQTTSQRCNRQASRLSAWQADNGWADAVIDKYSDMLGEEKSP